VDETRRLCGNAGHAWLKEGFTLNGVIDRAAADRLVQGFFSRSAFGRIAPSQDDLSLWLDLVWPMRSVRVTRPAQRTPPDPLFCRLVLQGLHLGEFIWLVLAVGDPSSYAPDELGPGEIVRALRDNVLAASDSNWWASGALVVLAGMCCLLTASPVVVPAPQGRGTSQGGVSVAEPARRAAGASRLVGSGTRSRLLAGSLGLGAASFIRYCFVSKGVLAMSIGKRTGGLCRHLNFELSVRCPGGC
jgi:hypothetical protein